MVVSLPIINLANRGIGSSPNVREGRGVSVHTSSRQPTLGNGPDIVDISSAYKAKIAHEDAPQNPVKLGEKVNETTTYQKESQERKAKVDERNVVEGEREVKKHLQALKMSNATIPKNNEAVIRKAKTITNTTLTNAAATPARMSLATSASKIESKARLALNNERLEKSKETSHEIEKENTTILKPLGSNLDIKA